ncbi:MAG: MerR family transcriptional regulator [Firmicutes bacterium]|nr:MerR family transcriptional regulator [Bacillota bacterium]
MDKSRSHRPPGRLHGPDEPVYTISVAARLLRVSPQLLRQLEREGILEPARTDANARLYCENELVLLRHVCSLLREHGINLAGVKHILEIERSRAGSPAGEALGEGASGEDSMDGRRGEPVGGPAGRR